MTDAVVAILKENPEPTSFLRSLFREDINETRSVSIGVRRKNEKVAVDVTNSSQGNRNTISKSSIKSFIPPLYKEYIDLTELDIYEQVANSTNVTLRDVMQIGETSAEHLMEVRKKIERAYELQAAQALQTGVVKLHSGEDINFKREAGSMVSKSGDKWSTNSTDPLKHLEEAAQFIRKEGNYAGGSFNVIMPSDVVSALTANETFQNRADVRRIDLDNIVSPVRNAAGGVPIGETSKGTYRFILWGYDEFYTDASGTKQPYLDSGNAIIIPEQPDYVFGYGAVPRLIGQGVRSGKYVIDDYIDLRNTTHEHRIQSAGVAVPTAVDTIFTLTDLV